MTGAFDLPYEARRNPTLPWGYWILIDADDEPMAPLLDEHGERWRSLREALWKGRLGMSARGDLGPADEEQLEFLLTILAMIDRSVVSAEGVVSDMFENSWLLTSHYSSWLSGQGLIEAEGNLATARLTPEGRAILVMLASTRPTDRAPLPIGLRGLHPFAQLRPAPDREAMEAAILAAESKMPNDTVRFLRKDLPNRASIVLVGAANARIPMAETHWSLGFAQTHHRDHVYAWMLAQADRWQDWFTIAREQRSGALTEHLLTLFIAQDCDEREI